ncbi:hypothetical protein [Flavobacterium sp.]|uniref:hypothetical protein n=1 Tax=Flavobacterium sp. TaxID=239 RepID=UPI002FD95819
MKRLFLALFLGTLTFSCSSDSSSGSSLSDTPTAKSEYDSSNYGIYKGVFVGSTGTVLINIKNEGTLSATLTIDGTASTYTSSETVTLATAIEGLTFTNGSSSFDFNVSAVGGNAAISNINISGHPNANIDIVKEYSNSLVKCYVGTFTGDSSGALNLIIKGNVLYGLAKPSDDNNSVLLSGSLTGTTIAGGWENGTFIGTASGNSMSGTWQNTFSESGSWSGTRKL